MQIYATTQAARQPGRARKDPIPLATPQPPARMPIALAAYAALALLTAGSFRARLLGPAGTGHLALGDAD